MSNENSEVKIQCERLKDLSWKTSKARFNASNRLRRKQQLLVYYIIIFTVIQIGLSILLISLSNESDIVIKIAATISIALSVFIALISNTESMTKSALNAHLLHKCGIELKSLNKKISIINPQQPDDLLKLSSEYDKIIADCNLNHEQIDYNLVLNDINTTPQYIKLKNCFQYYFDIYCTFFICLISASAFGFLFFCIYKRFI